MQQCVSCVDGAARVIDRRAGGGGACDMQAGMTRWRVHGVSQVPGMHDQLLPQPCRMLVCGATLVQHAALFAGRRDDFYVTDRASAGRTRGGSVRGWV